MLADDENLSQTNDIEQAVGVSLRMADPARKAMVDVVSLRGLAQAVQALRGRSERDLLDAALSRMINVNGAIAKALEGDR